MYAPLKRPRGVTHPHLRQRRLVACLIATLGLGNCADPLLAATTWPVGRCGDTAGKGGDTLRIAINRASSGDTIDLAPLPLTCSTITLGAEIPIAVNYLHIEGPYTRNVTIDGNHASRVFNHSGSGTLKLSYISIANGQSSGDGGCVYSSGSASLVLSSVSGCAAGRSGGALFTAGNTTLSVSTISGNHANMDYYSAGTGGAIYAQANVFADSSTISNNQASTNGGVTSRGAISMTGTGVRGNTSYGGHGGQTACAMYASSILDLNLGVVEGNSGGVCASDVHLNSVTISNNNYFTGVKADTVTIANSTISGNGTGIDVRVPTGNVAGPVTISNSTISGNSGGGIFARNAVLDIKNSTIAFNNNRGIQASVCDLSVTSSIIAHNTFQVPLGPIVESDVDASQCNPSGDHNLIMSSNIPFSLTLSSDPQLMPLGNHGGPTRTHALLSNSPAIDHGSNPGNLPDDQRGTGYTRVVGAPDIGAYERQPNDDELFFNGFD